MRLISDGLLCVCAYRINSRSVLNMEIKCKSLVYLKKRFCDRLTGWPQRWWHHRSSDLVLKVPRGSALCRETKLFSAEKSIMPALLLGRTVYWICSENQLPLSFVLIYLVLFSNHIIDWFKNNSLCPGYLPGSCCAAGFTNECNLSVIEDGVSYRWWMMVFGGLFCVVVEVY